MVSVIDSHPKRHARTAVGEHQQVEPEEPVIKRARRCDISGQRSHQIVGGQVEGGRNWCKELKLILGGSSFLPRLQKCASSLFIRCQEKEHTLLMHTSAMSSMISANSARRFGSFTIMRRAASLPPTLGHMTSLMTNWAKTLMNPSYGRGVRMACWQGRPVGVCLFHTEMLPLESSAEREKSVTTHVARLF